MDYYEFTSKVFNILNGCINPLNKAIKLNFNDSLNLCGHSFMNGCESIIELNVPRCVIKGNDEDSIKTILIDVVTHELSHLDQDIDMALYNSDPVYKDTIEAANSKNNIYFMINFKDWLEKTFKFKLAYKCLNLTVLTCVYPYQIRSIEDIILSRLRVIFNPTMLQQVDASPNVILSCGLERIIVKSNNEYNQSSIYNLNSMIRQLRGIPITATYSYTEIALELRVRKEI